jgi:hypothetical protein
MTGTAGVIPERDLEHRLGGFAADLEAVDVALVLEDLREWRS